jgi:plasmid replication initiation protein
MAKQPPKEQLDLFVAIAGELPTHDQQDMMERPFFSLSKEKRTTPIDYRVRNGNQEVIVHVTANAETGMATIWDADILIWAASQIRAAKQNLMGLSRTFRVSAYELLRAIDRGTSGKEYQLLIEAFQRLQGTRVETSIRQQGKKLKSFVWIEEFTVVYSPDGKPSAIEFRIAEWLFLGIQEDRLTLAIDRRYFALTGGIERWLYRVVRKHAGHQKEGWQFTMTELHQKSGSVMRLADFAKHIRKVVQRQRLPGYWLELVKDYKDREAVHFVEKNAAFSRSQGIFHAPA